ncbi:MAG: L-seryl-tRNA(Sec) selenium transferase [Chloroflexota bacterium]
MAPRNSAGLVTIIQGTLPDAQPTVLTDSLRSLPSVDAVLRDERLVACATAVRHEVLVDTVRRTLAAIRERVKAGQAPNGLIDPIPEVLERVAAIVAPPLRRVINATGVVIHTNLGRAPLSEAALAAIHEVGTGYSNLELDLESGGRGSRHDHAAGLLRRATGAEDALVVNNCAAALVLILAAFAAGREVVVSRGELVEIGGGVRIPDVLRQSGARLVEVGTTNRTYVRDYAEAVNESTALILGVHTSNFRVVGFATTPEPADLAALAAERGVRYVQDLGSGALLDTARFGLAPEPRVQDAVRAGVDLACFSGDKLLGGPQAGIIVGRAAQIRVLKAHPLTRAIRPDKATLAGLCATLLHYLRGEAEDRVPVWRMIARPLQQLRERAGAVAAALSVSGVEAAVIEGRSAVGGGSLPGETLATWLVAVSGRSTAGDTMARLRHGSPPVVARVEDGRVLLDPRTVEPADDAELIRAVRAALT